MVRPLRHQPFKGAYLAYQALSTLLIRIPLWLLLAIPRRPRPSWGLNRVLWVNAIRHLMYVTARTGPITVMPNHLAITPGAGVNGVWVEPTPELVAAELKIWALAASVSTVRIPGYWIHKQGTTIQVAASPMPGEKVIYHLHGGAFVRLSAHPTDPTANIARGALQHIDSVHRVFSLEYRLASAKPHPVVNPFPASLLDVLAGYNYLVNVVGFSPSDIIVEGDSAGANLAHALVRYLVENQGASDINLPASPGALLLLSPWCDIGTSHVGPGSSITSLIDVDYIGDLNGKDNIYPKNAYLGPHGMGAAELNRYISPASLHPSMSISFKGFPRTFIVGGGAEVLIDQIRTLKDRMINDLGEGNGVREGEGKVRYYEVPDGVHDYLVFDWHEPERSDTFREIAAWVNAS